MNGKEIRDYLDIYKFKHSTLGFQFMEAAIQMCQDDPKYRNHMMQLYQKVADQFDTTESSVERALYHSIRSSTYGPIAISEFIARSLDALSD